RQSGAGTGPASHRRAAGMRRPRARYTGIGTQDLDEVHAMNEQHEGRPTDPTPDQALPALRREAGTRPHDPRGVAAMTAVIALAGVTIGFALALLAVPMHRCPASPLRVVERAPAAVQVVPWHAEDVSFLGVVITTGEEPGALVRRVMARAPAHDAGLR